MAVLNDLIATNVADPGSINDKLIAYFSGIYRGVGTPEGVVNAPKGSTFVDVLNAVIYLKETATGTLTGWRDISTGGGGGGGSTVVVKDEGSTVVAAATTLDIVGRGIAASAPGGATARITNTSLVLGATAVKTANYNAAADEFIRCDTSGGAFAVTLPTTPANGTLVGIKLTTAGNTLTFNCGGSDVINRAAGVTTGTLTFTNQAILMLYSSADGVWSIVADDLPKSVLDTLYVPLGSRPITVVIDGGGSAITTGAKKVYVTVPYKCTITKWRILLDQSGSIVLDIWKDTYANQPPTVADTITAAAKPTVTTAIKNESTVLTAWTTAIAVGDVLEVNVDSITTATKAILTLFVTPIA